MRKFMLITNRYKDRDLTLSNEIVSYIQQKGGSAAICVSNVEDDNQKDFALSEIPADTECILVLGGDGTLIRAATKVEALLTTDHWHATSPKGNRPGPFPKSHQP